jgi:D-sedoheptulose 7-phosphate isomerase
MDYLQQLIERYPRLSPIRPSIIKAFEIMAESFSKQDKLLIAGNGGSAADAQHIVGELMKGFKKRRPVTEAFAERLRSIHAESAEYLITNIQQGLPAIALSSHVSLTTAVINDIDGNIIYAQEVSGYGRSGDVFLGISTSGNAKNILYAMISAKAKNLSTIALTGGTGGAIAGYADAAIIVPETETYKIQELHLPVYHTLCLMLEERFFP